MGRMTWFGWAWVVAAGCQGAPSAGLGDGSVSAVQWEHVDGQPTETHLTALDVHVRWAPNTDLFAPHYVERVVDPSGASRRLDAEQWASRSACYLQGQVYEGDEPVGHAAMTGCRAEAPQMWLSRGGEWFGVQWDGPLARLSALELPMVADPHRPRRVVNVAAPSGPLPPPPPVAWMVQSLVHDASRSALVGAQAHVQGATLFNLTHALYRDAGLQPTLMLVLREQVTLASATTFTPSDVGGVEVSTDELLAQFNGWSPGALASDADGHVLLSGLDFDGPTVGLAVQEGMCGGASSGAVVMAQDATGYEAAILAHELGHNLGAGHDGVDNTCLSEGFIMASSVQVGGVPPESFSTCSKAEVEAFLASPSAACLSDRPGLVDGGPTCGNGVVEAGEACDCGPSGCDGLDPCCDGDTCQLTAQATCSALDGCCDASTCAPHAAEEQVVCREAQHPDCDLPEVCDGGRACPADESISTGSPCATDLGDGACFAGACVDRGTECDSLSEGFSLDLSYGEVCDPFVDETPCAQVFCAAEEECFALNDQQSVPLIPADGTPCGDGLQCMEGDCVPSNELDGFLDQCPEDALKSEPGVCGCGVADVDSDGDGALDCLDDCPQDATKSSPGDCGCGTAEADADLDGLPDCIDLCPDDPTSDCGRDGKEEPVPLGCACQSGAPLGGSWAWLAGLAGLLGLRRRAR